MLSVDWVTYKQLEMYFNDDVTMVIRAAGLFLWRCDTTEYHSVYVIIKADWMDDWKFKDAETFNGMGYTPFEIGINSLPLDCLFLPIRDLILTYLHRNITRVVYCDAAQR